MPDHPSQPPDSHRRYFVHCADAGIAPRWPQSGDTITLPDGRPAVVDSAHGPKLTVDVVDGACS